MSPAVGYASDADRALLERYLREDQRRMSSANGTAPMRRSSVGPACLSLPQEQIFHRAQQNTDKPPFFNECITVHRKGSLDVPTLERSLLEIIRRHEIWRTTYDDKEGHPVQTIHDPPSHLSLPILDLRGLSECAQEVEVCRSVGELSQCPFDLRRGPLLRFLLIRTDESLHRLFLVVHQSIVDGVSAYQVFPTELAALYQAFSEGKPSPLPDLTIQFADYAEWQRRWLGAQQINQQMDYWRKQLAGELPLLRWPPGGARPKKLTYRGLIRPFAFRKDLAAALKSTARRAGVTLFMALLSGFVALLHHYSTQTDILVGTLSPAGRKRTESEKLLGYFLNPVVLRFDLTSNPEFCGLLEQTREVVSEAISHDDLPLELLGGKLKPVSDPGRHPYFNVAVSLQPPVPETIRPEWDVTSMDIGSGGAMWDLYVAFIDRQNGLIGRAQYNPDIFSGEQITRMLSDLEALLAICASQPQWKLSDLSKMIDKE
jgi:Condensation domain